MKINFSGALLMCLFFASCNLFAQDRYRIEADIENIQNDKISVTVIPPKISEKKAYYVFPAVIPGSYSRKDFGRFIESFHAFDDKGKSLPVKQKDKNVFEIKNADKLAKITYLVNDTWDDTDFKDNFIFQPGGTNIEAGKNIVINHQGFWGYIDGKKMLPYEISITKPTDFHPATALSFTSENNGKAVFSAPNYVRLVDSPIMFSKPDTVSFRVNNMDVRISVYSETNSVKAEKVRELVMPLGAALGKFFGEMPVERYDFIMYFSSFFSPNARKGGFGALEHSYCSFYFLPEISGVELDNMIKDVAAHEFLHILTPLNIHSEEIEYFDFVNPKMSRHLWLYEGVTEYFSIISQTQAGMSNADRFFETMSEKFTNAEKYKDVSFTEMSKNILSPQYKDDYNNVYYKGALIAMLLDIRIHELSKNQKSLKSVLMQLAKKYGPSKPFKDENFIAEFVALTYPEINDFFADYIEGSKPLPLEEYFKKVGFFYKKTYSEEVLTFGKMSVGFNAENNTLLFTETSHEANVFGAEDGDVILAINGLNVTPDNYETAFLPFRNADEDTQIEIKVKRKNETLTLRGKPKTESQETKNYLRFVQNVPKEISERRNAIFGASLFDFE
jgi:predicted metalloprotease with PDZ domain